LLFLKSEKGHIWVFSHYHTIIGTKGEVQRRYRRTVEVGGGDLGGGEGEGRVGAICFIFPSHLPFLGFPLITS